MFWVRFSLRLFTGQYVMTKSALAVGGCGVKDLLDAFNNSSNARGFRRPTLEAARAVLTSPLCVCGRGSGGVGNAAHWESIGPPRH